MGTSCNVYKLGTVDYTTAFELQKRLLLRRIGGDIPDSILFLEHPSVFTVGVSGKDEHIITSHSKEGIPVLRVDRGGSITYHGPGQLIGYFIIDLKGKGINVREFVNKLEETIILTLRKFFIEAVREADYPGVWVRTKKICALGIRVAKGCTKHGFALNIDTNLRYFDYILPCGIKGRGVTSMSEILGFSVSINDVTSYIIECCAKVFDLNIKEAIHSGIEVII